MPTANVYESPLSPFAPYLTLPPPDPGVEAILRALTEGAAMSAPPADGESERVRGLVGEARTWAQAYWSAPLRADLTAAEPFWLLAGARALGATAKLIQATEVGDDRLDVDVVSLRVAMEFGEVVGLPSAASAGRRANHHTSLDRLRAILATLPTPRCRSLGERPAHPVQLALRLAEGLAEGSGLRLSEEAEILCVEYSLAPVVSPLTSSEGWQCLGLRWVAGLRAAGAIGRWIGVLCRREGRILETADARLGLEVVAALGLPCLPRIDGRSSLAPLMELRRRVTSRLATLT